MKDTVTLTLLRNSKVFLIATAPKLSLSMLLYVSVVFCRVHVSRHNEHTFLSPLEKLQFHSYKHQIFVPRLPVLGLVPSTSAKPRLGLPENSHSYRLNLKESPQPIETVCKGNKSQ